MCFTFFLATVFFYVVCAEETHFGCVQSRATGSCSEVIHCTTDNDCSTDSYCGNEEGVKYCMKNPVDSLSEDPAQITDLVHINGTSSASELAPSSNSVSSEHERRQLQRRKRRYNSSKSSKSSKSSGSRRGSSERVNEWGRTPEEEQDYQQRRRHNRLAREADRAQAERTQAYYARARARKAAARAALSPTTAPTADQGEFSASSASSTGTESTFEPEPSSTTDQNESSVSSDSSEPAPSSTTDHSESSSSSASSEQTISPTLTTTAAPINTDVPPRTPPPVKCRLLVFMDQSYSITHGGKEGALLENQRSMPWVVTVFGVEALGVPFDAEYIVDVDNILGDDMTGKADFNTIRNLLQASTDPLLAGINGGAYCTPLVMTSREILVEDGATGASGLGCISNY
jgi:hypothetical protein